MNVVTQILNRVLVLGIIIMAANAIVNLSSIQKSVEELVCPDRQAIEEGRARIRRLAQNNIDARLKKYGDKPVEQWEDRGAAERHIVDMRILDETK